MSSTAALAALLDPTRLMVAGALVGAQRTAGEVASHTGLDREKVLTAIGTLRQAGLVEADGDRYSLPAAALRDLAAQVSDPVAPMDPYIGAGMSDEERVVLSRFFRGRSLVEIPTSRAKRLVVLERIALEFDLGRRYPESAVNDVLRVFHPDVAALRRHLVDEGLLDRDRGEYWRSGGRFGVGSGGADSVGDAGGHEVAGRSRDLPP